MFDILQYLPARTKKGPSGWWSFNAPCCVHNGETRDKRKRGGIILDRDDWSFHCFNCKFKTRFKMGQSLSLKTRKFLSWLGVDDYAIKKLNLESIKNKRIYDIANDRTRRASEIIHKNIFFKKHDLPPDARPITTNDKWAINYLKNRAINYHEYPFKITPGAPGREARKIIIPYFYGGDHVGWTQRYLDDIHPRYKNMFQQPGFVFNLDAQGKYWDYIIVMEGVFCAISIEGVAVLHNEINNHQAAILRRTGKEVIVVPDQDSPGIGLAEQAIELGFSISLPHWSNNVKDVNDAVRDYSKLGALLSIIDSKVSSRIKARVAINDLKKRKKL